MYYYKEKDEYINSTMIMIRSSGVWCTNRFGVKEGFLIGRCDTKSQLDGRGCMDVYRDSVEDVAV